MASDARTRDGRGQRDPKPNASEDRTLPALDSPSGPASGGPLPERGSFLGRYQVGEPLGVGGMGAVFSGWDPQLARPVALKIVYASGAEAERGQERLLSEAQAMAQLRHPNVLPVYDAGSWEGRVFLAMELVDGMNLGQWMKQTRRKPDQLAELLHQAALGLAAAHAAGIVHRDVKAANILVTRQGKAMLTDFGIARVEAGEVTNASAEGPRSPIGDATAAGAVVGTPGYIAPESLLGGNATPAADVYALGVTAYQLFTGELPFPPALVPGAEDRSRKPRRLGRVPRRWRKLVSRMFAADAARRPKSMAEVAQEFAPATRAKRLWRFAWIAALIVFIPVFGFLGLLGLSAFGMKYQVSVTDSRSARALNAIWFDKRNGLAGQLSGTPEEVDEMNRLSNFWCQRWADARLSVAFEASMGQPPPALIEREGNCLEDGIGQLTDLGKELSPGKPASEVTGRLRQLPDPWACIRMRYGPRSENVPPWPPP